nr:hypothetical protein [uncultured Kingella sp.]
MVRWVVCGGLGQPENGVHSFQAGFGIKMLRSVEQGERQHLAIANHQAA